MVLRRPTPLAAIALACAALAIPGTALAASGGSGLGTGVPTSPPVSAPTTQDGNVTVTTSGDGVTVSTRASAMLSAGMTFTGTAKGAAGKTIEIERSGHQTGWHWAGTVHTTVNPDGTFSASWATNHIGRFAIRAVVVSGQARTAAATPAMTVTVYRPSIATEYGPGFYGRRTACGVHLTRATIGVANKTLRCGEKVALFWGGRTLVVPVIDRGPYANHADWDLTTATATALHFPGKARIGAVSLPQQPGA